MGNQRSEKQMSKTKDYINSLSESQINDLVDTLESLLYIARREEPFLVDNETQKLLEIYDEECNN